MSSERHGELVVKFNSKQWQGGGSKKKKKKGFIPVTRTAPGGLIKFLLALMGASFL